MIDFFAYRLTEKSKNQSFCDSSFLKVTISYFKVLLNFRKAFLT